MKRIFALFFGIAFLSSCVSKKDFTALTDEKTSLESQLMRTKSNIEDLQSQLDELNQSKGELEKEKEALESNLNSVISQVDENKKEVEALKENLDQKQYQLNQLWTDVESTFSSVEAAVAQSQASIKEYDNFLYLDFNDSFTFRSGSEAVLNENKETLQKIADMMKRNPEMTMVVEGHADKRGIVSGKYIDNWDLSISRATSVIRELIEMGVNPAKLVASGRGESLPVTDGKTAAELEPNRRAEFIIVPNIGKIYRQVQEKK